jgi:hypothetical protein
MARSVTAAAQSIVTRSSGQPRVQTGTARSRHSAIHAKQNRNSMSIVGSTCPTIPVKPRLCIVQRGAAFFDCSLDRCAGRGPMRYALRILQRALSTRPQAFPSKTNLPIASWSFLSLEAIRPQIVAGRRRKSRHRSERRNAAAHACRQDWPAIRSTSARRHERSARAIAAESRRGESSRSTGQEHARALTGPPR